MIFFFFFVVIPGTCILDNERSYFPQVNCFALMLPFITLAGYAHNDLSWLPHTLILIVQLLRVHKGDHDVPSA